MWGILVLILLLAGCAAQPPLQIRAWQPIHLTPGLAPSWGDDDDEDTPPPLWLWGGPCRLKFNRELLEFIELTRDDATIAPLYRGVRWRLLRRMEYPRQRFRAVLKYHKGRALVYAVTMGAMPTKLALYDGGSRRWFDPENCAELFP